ncbi:hypothetical protein LCGC14_2301180 [marine sediment metagenome]|uniref:Uncharacterized protein n=1 Tax=marine sediment metagenome TaxID=412755 RepID=A0A0F9FIE6_9ZZZZ
MTQDEFDTDIDEVCVKVAKNVVPEGIQALITLYVYGKETP